MSAADATHQESDASAGSGLTEDLVCVPVHRRHDEPTDDSLRGIPLALLLVIPGSLVLGAGYGAFMALCGETLVNITVACSFPFWMHAPALLGLMWGHVHHQRWRRRVELLGFLICLYGISVGWVACVLDGPGLVFHPVQLAGLLTDTSFHGIWINGVSLIDLTPELSTLAPFLGVLRGAEVAWILFAGLLCLDGVSPFPWCHSCRCWMHDAATLRLNYQPESVEDVRRLAAELVEEDYDALLQLDEPVKPKAKGLEISVFRCGRCGASHVMNLRWYRATPDPDKSETERLLESAAGIAVVTGLQIPQQVQTHMTRLAERRAA